MEVDYFTLYPSSDLEQMKRDIDIVHSVNGIYILGTHYHAFSTKIRSGESIGHAFKALLDHISGKDGIEFISYRELWQLPDYY